MSTRKNPQPLGHRDELSRSPITDTHYALRCLTCGLKFTTIRLLDEGELIACPECDGRHLLVVDVELRPKARR